MPFFFSLMLLCFFVKVWIICEYFSPQHNCIVSGIYTFLYLFIYLFLFIHYLHVFRHIEISSVNWFIIASSTGVSDMASIRVTLVPIQYSTNPGLFKITFLLILSHRSKMTRKTYLKKSKICFIWWHLTPLVIDFI